MNVARVARFAGSRKERTAVGRLAFGLLCSCLIVGAIPAVYAQTLEWDPWSMDFGTVYIGDTEYRTLTLSNADTVDPLTISSVEFTFNDRGMFGLEVSEKLPVVLPPGESMDVVFSFTPTDFSFTMADVLIENNSTNAPSLYYSMLAAGEQGRYSALFAIDGLGGPSSVGLGVSVWDKIVSRQYARRFDPSNGNEINAISLTPNTVTEVIPIADLNGNGAAEVVVLAEDWYGFVEAKVKDSKTGELLSKISFAADYDPLWLRVVPDTGNDGSPDLAVLGVNSTGRPRAQVKDALSGDLVSRVYFEIAYVPFGFEVLEDLNENGFAELAVIGVDDVGRVRAQVKDVISSEPPLFVFFDRTYIPTHVTGVDIDADGQTDALAVLGENSEGIIRAQVKDVATASRLGIVRFESGYTPRRLLSIPDINSSGSPELALLQKSASGGTRVQIKDVVTEDLVSVIAFDDIYQPRDIVVLPDVDDNGHPELAYLGEFGAGSFLLQVKDVITSEAQVYQPFE